ncbi:MAG: methyl-accepting chemotaxis protein [Wenzhouxiangellaceae bacterium]|nr:methyl-accepting chemotaxis protein [Wenzhouxiangellaceae bacterium]
MATAKDEMLEFEQVRDANGPGASSTEDYTDLKAKFAAISRVQGVIEFELDGTIITANENFLRLTEYTLDELRGQKHSRLVSAEYARSREYEEFWRILRSGQFHAGMFPRINKSGKTFWINASYNPVFDEHGQPYKVVKFATDGTEIHRQKIENLRLQEAVDGATVNIMMCDEDQNIVYINPAAKKMFHRRADAFRKIYPAFRADDLVGKPIEIFHRNPAHQRELLKDKNRMPHHSEFELDEYTLGVTATLINDNDGNYLGNMVEWQDLTEQRRAEAEVKQLVDAAVAGDFSRRLDSDAYEGFFKELSANLNVVVDVTETGLGEVVAMMRALAEGSLDRAIEGEFQGMFAELQVAANTTLGALRAGFTDVSRVLNSLAQGDLTDWIADEHPGLFAQLKEDANATITDLRNAVSQIRENAASITVSAGEISQGNTDLSQRTEEQASSLEETASSMEQMTSAVRSSADNARQANQLAAGAREQAEKGGEVINEAVEAMRAINESSSKIADIIGVIDEIAFQTNLLALNAAVEAARAGEQGRGFAVVASEVRNLAQRSAEAAKEIKGLIKDSTGKVQQGSRLVDQSGESLAEIVTGAKKVSDIISEIAAAAQEQSAGIDEVNKAITQLDEVTQQNAALVEESAAASKSMDEQAQALTELMEHFKLSDDASAGRPARLSAPRQTGQPSPRPLAQSRPSHGSAPALRRPTHAGPQPSSGASGKHQGDDWEEF